MYGKRGQVGIRVQQVGVVRHGRLYMLDPSCDGSDATCDKHAHRSLLCQADDMAGKVSKSYCGATI
jgi:hypothetical protein